MWAWAMSPAKYVHEAVRNCTVHLSTNYGGKYRMPKKVQNPFKMGYDPELDTKVRSQCSILLPNDHWHSKMDDRARENQRNNQGNVIVVPHSTP